MPCHACPVSAPARACSSRPNPDQPPNPNPNPNPTLTLTVTSANVHPSPLTLWDPFGFTNKLTPEEKAKKLNAEVTHGLTLAQNLNPSPKPKTLTPTPP